jgi:hypothetical protein
MPPQGGSGHQAQQIQAELAAAAEVPLEGCPRGPYAARRWPESPAVRVLARPPPVEFPASPVESDSVDYEQPGSSALLHSLPLPSRRGSRARLLLGEEDDEEAEDGELEERVAGLSDVECEELGYGPMPSPGGCLLHGRMPPRLAPELALGLGEPNFWFDDITWGRFPGSRDHGTPVDEKQKKNMLTPKPPSFIYYGIPTAPHPLPRLLSSTPAISSGVYWARQLPDQQFHYPNCYTCFNFIWHFLCRTYETGHFHGGPPRFTYKIIRV